MRLSPPMATPNDYERFVAFARNFTGAHPQQDIAGDYYDQPGTIVYRQATYKLAAGGRVEVNTITAAASPAFAWEVEITINDKVGGRFIHLILQRDHEVVETYGKTILPIDGDRTSEILAVLNELSAT